MKKEYLPLSLDQERTIEEIKRIICELETMLTWGITLDSQPISHEGEDSLEITLAKIKLQEVLALSIEHWTDKTFSPTVE